MNNLRNIFLSIIALIIIAETCYSQDLKAGIIQVRHISGYTYEANIKIYHEVSTYINRAFILLNWGDGSELDTIYYQSGNGGCGDTNTITKNFVSIHTYQSPGNYIISSYIDGFRVSGINNITNSENEKLYLQHNLMINPSLGLNSPPVIIWCAVEKYRCCPFIYNAGASDPDGDSLVYSMVPPYTTNYTFPPYTINNVTGDFILYPTTIGKYAFSMKIEEWRHNYLLGSTYQEMLIEVNSLSYVEDNNFNNKVLNIYPNPCTDNIILELPVIEKDKTKIQIIDYLGRYYNAKYILNGNRININVQSLTQGVYLMKVTSGNSIYYSKFLKY